MDRVFLMFRVSTPPDNTSRSMESLIRMSVLFKRLRLVALLGALLVPGIASARNFIVASSGGDFATVAAGVGAAQAGDTVTVRAGTYNEAVTFGRSGSAAAFITLQGQPGAILDGTGKSGQGIIISSKHHIRVNGMTVQNFKGTG